MNIIYKFHHFLFFLFDGALIESEKYRYIEKEIKMVTLGRFANSFVVSLFFIIFLSCAGQKLAIEENDIVPYVPPEKFETGISLPGGGFRGAFQVGALKYLVEEFGLDFQLVAGVSVGALNAVLVAQRKTALLKEVWMSIKEKKEIYQEPNLIWGAIRMFLLGKNGLNDATALEELIDRYVDINTLRASGIELHIGVVNFQTNKYETYTQESLNIKKFVLASASVPAQFELVKIKENGEEHQFADGGLRHMIPYKSLIFTGIKKLIVILPFNRKSNCITYKKEHVPKDGYYNSPLEVVMHTIEIQMHETYINDISDMLSLAKKKGVVVTFVEPELNKESCDFGVFDFDIEKIKKCIQYGEDQARKVFPMN